MSKDCRDQFKLFCEKSFMAGDGGWKNQPHTKGFKVSGSGLSKGNMLLVVTCDIVLVMIKSKQLLCLPSTPAKSLPWNNVAYYHKIVCLASTCPSKTLP